jgi:hypothetical protein
MQGLESWGSTSKTLCPSVRRLLDGPLSRTSTVVVRVLPFAGFACVALNQLALP